MKRNFIYLAVVTVIALALVFIAGVTIFVKIVKLIHDLPDFFLCFPWLAGIIVQINKMVSRFVAMLKMAFIEVPVQHGQKLFIPAH